MKEYFSGIPRIEFKGKDGDALSFRFYNPDEKLGDKTMREHLKFAMSYWHTLCGSGSDLFGLSGTLDKSFGESETRRIFEAKAYAGFELMDKLGIDYFCFHDRDIAPEGETLAQSHAMLDDYAALIEKLMADTGRKLLWGTANLFGNKRYLHGAATSCNADVFTFAAAQVKKAIEVTKRLGGDGYVFWGGREGYTTLLNTNLGLEQDNLARMLTLARDYARSMGFDGLLYIEPKPMEPTAHQYDYDVATVLAFLRKYGLENDFKMNIEANHASLAGHSFAHELRVARENGVFGSIDANQGEIYNGWDTDNFPSNVYDVTLAMVEVIKAGGFTKGGTNFDAKLRRESIAPEDVFRAYIMGMDTMALGFKLAYKLIEDGRIDRFVEERYASYKTGIGARIVNGQATMDELEQYALQMGDVTTNKSGSQEYLEGIINAVMFS